VLTAAQLAALNWHPLRDVGRVENFALKAQPTIKGLRYVMACGHSSFIGKTVCERGCLTAPNWNIEPVRHPEWDPVLKRAYRKDHELERRLHP